MLEKRHNVFNFALIVLSWLSVLFLSKRDIKRFFPASLVILIMELITAKIGQRRKWWVFYEKPDSFVKNELPFSVGPYLPGAMWILKLTYGNFLRFLLLNAFVNALFAFPGIKFLQKAKIAQMARFNGFQFFRYLFIKAPILYGLQAFFEKNKVLR